MEVAVVVSRAISDPRGAARVAKFPEEVDIGVGIFSRGRGVIL